jgi:hypothetical protein
MLCCLASPVPALACDYGDCSGFPRTTLLEIRREQAPARELEIVKFGGYELADGRYQSFSQWYAGRLTTTRAEFVTQLAPGLALLWGLSTGENREKYRLQPAARIGLLAIQPLGPRASVSLSARTTFAGRLQERPCTADYGAIGGVQRVNCRLAASELVPEDTLKYLWNFRPPDHTQVTLRLTTLF